MLKNLLIIALFITVSVSAASAQDKTPAETKSPAAQNPKKTNSRPATKSAKAVAVDPFEKASIETMAAQCVKLETETGVVELEMFPESAPESVRGFLNLVATKSLDTTTFSRVVPGFIIQGGDLGTHEKYSHELAKRAARTLPDEPSQIKHERGILSMARAAEPNTATTGFFILVGTATHLDGTFAAFGRVVRGMETVDAINKAPVEGEKPKKPVRINRAIVAPCVADAKPVSGLTDE